MIVNAEKTKQMYMFNEENLGQKSQKVTNKSFKMFVNFKRFGLKPTNQRCIQEELKSKLNSGKILFYSVQNTSYLCLLKILKIKIYRNATMPGILYCHETCFPILKEESGPRVVERSVTIILFTLEREGSNRTIKMHNDVLHDLLFGWPKEVGSGGSEMYQYRKNRKACRCSV
jgi:hypothetical protein